jgi:hypothetical protein
MRKGVMVSPCSSIEEGDLDYSWPQFTHRTKALIRELKKQRATYLNTPLD